MGKTKKRYPASRILALILAVAMSVTMIPQTALAAPADDSATENLVNDIATEGGDDADADANKGTGSDDADTNTDIDSSDADTGKNTGSDEVDGNNGADDGMAEVNADDNTPVTKPVYEIAISGDFISKAEYSGNNRFTDITTGMVLKKDGEEVTDPDEIAKITCTWKQKGADDAYVAMPTGSAPKDAGSYQAVLIYPAVEGVHDGAEFMEDCEITKAPVTIALEDTDGDGRQNVKPGTKRSAVAIPTIV